MYGRNRSPATIATTATGTLTRKIARQPEPNRLRSISEPPTSGPATAPSPITGPTIANAFCWPSSPNSSRVSPKPCGTMIAAIAPCSVRAAISAPGDGASAHSAEAAPNAPTPVSSTRRRPRMSPSRLPSSSITDIASV